MPDVADALKRALVGRPVRSERIGPALLPKRTALPVFGSDATSSVAYAPDEVLLTLSLAGVTAYAFAPWVGVAVAVVLLTVVASYRQTVHAYPGGGGDYEVASVNLGRRAGQAVASALLVDYVLTVAVAVSAGAHYLTTFAPALRGHETQVAVALVVALTLVNVRGVRESGAGMVLPTYLFMGAMGLLIGVGSVQALLGTLAPAASAELELVAQPGMEEGLTGLAGAFLVLRAFSSGCAALTGVQGVSGAVPAFRKPKARNAATTLLVLGVAGVIMTMGVLLLVERAGVRYVEDPATQLRTPDGLPVPAGYQQDPSIVQLAEAVFRDAPALVVVVSVATALVLVLAANSAFNGFPVLGSILAKEGLLPRQLHTRGDRLALSNGILTLAATAITLVVVFDAQVTRLIHLYIVGAFVGFAVSQLGMVRHWRRHLQREADPGARARMQRSRAMNSFGFVLTTLVLAVVLVTKFTRGAWLVLVLMAVVFVTTDWIRKHYQRVAEELTVTDPSTARALPSRVHAIVLVSRVHQPTMRALAYARATRPSLLEAVTVAVDDNAQRLRQEWAAADLPVPLTILDSPFREITRPVLEYVRSIRRESPRGLVVVFVPEYAVGRWWERILHNRSALRLKSRLRFTAGVVVASVPWQLTSTPELDLAASGALDTTELGWVRRGE